MSDPKREVALDILRRLLRDERVRETEAYTFLVQALAQTGQISEEGAVEEGDVFALLEEELVRFDEELADSMEQDVPTMRPAEGWLRSGIQSGAIGIVADRDGYTREALLLYRRAVLSFGSALGVDLKALVERPAPGNGGQGGEVVPFRRPDRD